MMDLPRSKFKRVGERAGREMYHAEIVSWSETVARRRAKAELRARRMSPVSSIRVVGSKLEKKSNIMVSGKLQKKYSVRLSAE